MKDIGKKRIERKRSSRVKVLRRREALRAAEREERKKELLTEKSRRKISPIQRTNLSEDLKIGFPTPDEGDMNMERKIDINQDNLTRNLGVLKDLEQEFVDTDNKRKENKEKMENADTDTFWQEPNN